MCPDYQMLSVYLDRELPAPWKEKMELHLQSCPACSAKLERFRNCSEALGKQPIGVAVAQDRVWQHIAQWEPKTWGWKRSQTIWRRTFTVPLPAVAAGAAFLIIAFALTLLRQPAATPPQQDTMASGELMHMQGIIPTSDIHEVLQYLGNQDMTDMVIIRLPETSNFSGSGEPTILRAADYSRRTGSR
ncbi:MAG: zf-HC2 domain-containing protein [Treponema sp.]|jgi:hypothetical protein|nr:zf-HC2 domain-containing protein [Treponema sp.]